MTASPTPDPYGRFADPETLTIQRLLPGPIERVWAYLTESDKRARWLAAGDMEMAAGAEFELVWRNDTLTDPPGRRPDDFGREHRMRSRILELDPPHRLVFSWDGSGPVSIDLEPRGERVLLTLIHRRLDGEMRLMVGPGWHCHLDVLAARLAGAAPEPFWDAWARLRTEYRSRFGG